MICHAWEILLVATIVIEGMFALALVGRGARGHALLCSVFANFLTHPVATFLHGVRGVPLTPIELAVILVEAVAYMLAVGLSWRRAIILSVVANGATWGLSLLL
jgi:hypothetical protein